MARKSKKQQTVQEYIQEMNEKHEKERQAALRAQEKIDAEDALIPEPPNAMSEEERNVYWGEDGNATSYLMEQINSSGIRGFEIKTMRGRSGIITGVIKDKIGRVVLNVEYKLPFDYRSARREDIPMVIKTLRARVQSDWEILDYAERKRNIIPKTITPEQLKPLIDEFKRDHGSDTVEYCRVIRDGKVIYDGTCGKEHSVLFGGDMKDADVIHNHPDNSPAMSENDIILPVYGNARSSTAVSKDHGSWSLIRPESGWGMNPNTFNKDVSKAFKKSLSNVKNSPDTLLLVSKARSGEIPLSEATDKFNKKWAEEAISKTGLRVTKYDAVASFEGLIALTAIFGGALAVVALLSVISPNQN